MEIKKKSLLIGIILVIVIATCVTYFIKRQSHASASGKSLKTIMVGKGDIESKVHALGTVDSSETTTFKADAPETVSQVMVGVGTQVKAGQNLITYESQVDQNSMDDANATLQSAEIDAASAQRDVADNNANRTILSPVSGKIVQVSIAAGQNVQANDVIAIVQNGSKKVQITSKTSGDVESSSVEVGDVVLAGQTIAVLAADPTLQDKLAKANIAVQQAKDKLNELISSETTPPVLAPFAGTVVSVSAADGDVVQKGDPLLELADLNKLQMTVAVDELDILKVKTGQDVQVTLNAMPGTTIAGKVDSISPIGNVQNGVSTFSVTISLSQIPGVMPGMTGEAYIITSGKSNILEVPLEAVQEKNGRQFVMVETADGKEVMTKIKTGIHDDQYVEITSGLKVGDQVVIPTSYVIDKGKNNKNKNKGTLKKMFGGGGKAGK